MFSFKEYLVEIYDVKPKVEYKHHENMRIHEFKVTHPSLKHTVTVELHPQHYNKNHAAVDIFKDNSDGYRKDSDLGTKHVMHVLGRIKHHVPHIEQIMGSRITGARKSKNWGENEGHINMTKVKPIPPEDN